MEYNSILPALVPAILILIVVSLAAWLGLAWDKRPNVQTFIRRAWLGVSIVCVAGVVLFWLSTVLVEGPKRATIDRSLQGEQQDELHRRVERGGTLVRAIINRTGAKLSALVALTLLGSCGQAAPAYFAVRPGFACKVLSPNGYERDWHDTGMMNLGGEGIGGIKNQAVCLETTTFQVEEQFAQDDPRDHQDHRVLTRSGQRVAYDFYVRLILPNDHAVWDSVIAQVTATPSNDPAEQGRVSYITVADIFERYGNQEARSFGRAVATNYDSDLDMNNNRTALENALTRNLDQRLHELRAPLQLQGVSVSNIVADPVVQNARNSALTASSVKEVAESYTENYVRMQQIQANERMINVLAASRNPSTIIFNASPNIAVPTAR